MSLVRIHNFSISLDGFGAGAGQELTAPFGHAGSRLMQWAFPTETFRAMGHPGDDAGTAGIDETFARLWNADVGVEIMGRNKFGPQRGPWDPDDDWQGWWEDDPPFHTPVVVLTHHPRAPIELEGGTTFHFLDADPAAALARARELAPGRDVRIGGGVATVREFLAADLVDRMHLVVVPIVLGRGERLWDGLEGIEERFHIESVASPSGVVHVTFARRPR